MNKIKLNNSEFEVEGYNKSTYFSGGTVNSNANCNIITNDINVLNALAETDITSIQIYSENVLIYNLQNIRARIENINEYLNGNRMSISVNFSFPNEVEAEPAP